MTLQAFLNKWNMKLADFDGHYGAQCVDIVQYYNRDVLGGSFLSGATAVDVWTAYNQDKCVKVLNTPTNVPQPGDIIFWSFNHVAIAVVADVNTLTSFDQNYPINSPCHFQEHDYKNALGWLTPKK